MALLRKDIRIAFYAGALLAAVGLAYAGVLIFGSSDDADDAVAVDDSAPVDTAPADPMGGYEPVAPAELADDLTNAGDTPTSFSASWDTSEEDAWSDDVMVTTTSMDADEPEQADDESVDLAAVLADFGRTEVVARPAVEPADRDFDVSAREHTLAEGDTFVSLAGQYYDDEKQFDVIRRANPQLDPRRLKIGDLVVIPALDGAGQPKGLPPLNGRPDTHTVRPGETLSDIASSRLGRSALWDDIYELNRSLIGEDPARLTVGMVLKLPK